MSLIPVGTQAPDFELESHLESKIRLLDFEGARNVLLGFFPLNFTPISERELKIVVLEPPATRGAQAMRGFARRFRAEPRTTAD